MTTKYQQLAQLLRTDLLTNSTPGGKLPTEAELVSRYHVSRQTVRRALQLLTNEGLIQRRQGSGSYIAGHENITKHIAIIISFYDDYIFPTLLRDAQNLLAQQGYSVTVYTTENSVSTEREILFRLIQQQISGILVEGSKTALPTPNADLYQKLQMTGTAILFLHGIYSNLSGIPCISDDNFAGGYQLANYLIGKGHTSIAGIFKSDDMQGLDRYHGYVSALRDAQLPIAEHAICWYDTQDRSVLVDRQDLQLLHRLLWERLNHVTAVICYNDEIANLLIRVLLSAGRQVPQDMAVVSFDNSYYAQICPVEITSLAHRSDRMGQFAAQQLIAMINGESVSSVSLDWTLIPRESG